MCHRCACSNYLKLKIDRNALYIALCLWADTSHDTIQSTTAFAARMMIDSSEGATMKKITLRELNFKNYFSIWCRFIGILLDDEVNNSNTMKVIRIEWHITGKDGRFVRLARLGELQ